MKKTFIAIIANGIENSVKHVGWLAWHTADDEILAEHCSIKEDFITTNENPTYGAAIEIDEEISIACPSVSNRLKEIAKRGYLYCPMAIDIVCEEDEEE